MHKNVAHNYSSCLFYIESPFQLMQAYELINASKICKYRLIVRRFNSTSNNDKQLKKTAKLLNININTYFSCRIKPLCIVISLYLLIQQRSFDNIYIGDENSIVFKLIKNIINPKKIVLLDDGVSTLTAPLSNDIYRRFTMFESKSNGLKLNDFTNIRERILAKNIRQKRHVVIGNNFVELGICSRKTYYKALKAMILSQPSNSKFVYISHRGEFEENLKDINKEFNFDLIRMSLPIELLQIELEIQPLTIHTILSTALFSMQLIYNNIECFSYKVHNSEIFARKRAVLELYKIIESERNSKIINVGKI